jgi:hypothetical protein
VSEFNQQIHFVGFVAVGLRILPSRSGFGNKRTEILEFAFSILCRAYDDSPGRVWPLTNVQRLRVFTPTGHVSFFLRERASAFLQGLLSQDRLFQTAERSSIPPQALRDRGSRQVCALVGRASGGYLAVPFTSRYRCEKHVCIFKQPDTFESASLGTLCRGFPLEGTVQRIPRMSVFDEGRL